MRIEILTRKMKKKAEILTLLAREPGLEATGAEVKVDGLQVSIGEDYLLFTIDRWERAQQVVPRLFSIVPGAYAPSYYEPVTDQKILVTAAAKPLPEIIGSLTTLEHLDLEAGELAGKFQAQWRARDVAVSAHVYLFVQGSVAVAKIKFSTHFRDSEHYCRKVLEEISLPEILTVFTPEVSVAPDFPVVEPVVIEKQITLKENNWNELLNLFPARITYLPGNDEYRLQFDPACYLAVKTSKEKIELLLHIENPDFLTAELIDYLRTLAGIEEVAVRKTIRRVTLAPDSLIKKLGFRKDKSFHLFTREDLFKTRYDIKRREVLMESFVSFAGNKTAARLREICRAMDGFAAEILKFAAF